MARGSRKAAVCSIQILLLTTCANAQSVTSALQDFGLFGTWAVVCKEMPSPRNEYTSVAQTRAGSVQLRNDFGRDYDEMVYRIVSAKRIGADKLALRQVLMNDSRIVLDNVMLKGEERMRVWSSRGMDGSTLVQDGTIPNANGHETRWVVRCEGQWTGDRKPLTDIKFVPGASSDGKRSSGSR